MDPESWICPIIAWCLVWGTIGGIVGALRDRAGAGVALGIFLGPLGPIVAVLLPRSPKAEAGYQLDVERERDKLRAQPPPPAPSKSVQRSVYDFIVNPEPDAHGRQSAAKQKREPISKCPQCGTTLAFPPGSHAVSCCICGAIINREPAPDSQISNPKSAPADADQQAFRRWRQRRSPIPDPRRPER